MKTNGHATRWSLAFATGLLAVSASTQAATAAVVTPPAAPAAPIALTLESVNDITLASDVSDGASSAAILRAQVLLDRAHFSPGEIDATYGGNLRLAVAAYQTANGLTASGIVDAATWAALNAAAAPALVSYTLTADDVGGPFVKIPASTPAKAKLKALGYTSASERLGETFHVSPGLLRQLNPGQKFVRAGDKIVVPNVADITPVTGVVKLVIDKSDGGLMLVDVADKVLARYPVSAGSEHDPLPIGNWTIKGVAMNPTFHYNPALFWDAAATSKKATLAPGPNNPVGVVWMDLSKEHYGIHGTPEPSKIGKTESHGCIRLTNWSALSVAAAIKPGTPAVLQE